MYKSKVKIAGKKIEAGDMVYEKDGIIYPIPAKKQTLAEFLITDHENYHLTHNA